MGDKHGKKRRYSEPPERGRRWSQEEDDKILEAVVHAKTPERLRGVYDDMALELGRVGKGEHAGNPIYRRAWALVLRYAEYTPSRNRRGVRVLDPPTAGEVWALRAAMDQDSEEAEKHAKGPCDAAYLAGVLGRTVDWTEAQMKKLDPRRGRPNLGFA